MIDAGRSECVAPVRGETGRLGVGGALATNPAR